MSNDLPTDSPLHAFTADEVKAIFAAGSLRTCAADEAIIKEGEVGDSMFFVIEGHAEARLEAGARVRSYGPGSYFGELSFINPGHRRSTTVVAKSAARLQVLDPSSVESLLSTHPKILVTLLRRTCAFLVDAERTLIGDLRRRNTDLEDTLKRLDFTRRRLSQEEAASRTDSLTGLFNRRGFDAELPSFMQRAATLGSGLALIAMDLDHFKPINDTLGHPAGDVVLREVGKILQGVRSYDLPCRVGGDEFIILLADITEQDAKNRADKLRAAIGVMPHPGNEQGIRVTSTMGGTLYRAGEAAEALMARADEALYAAKRAGRNRLGWL